MTHPKTLAGLTLALALTAVAPAQQQGLFSKNQPPKDAPQEEIRTFPLTGIINRSDAEEIVTALRNMLNPGDRIYLLNNQNVIVISAPAEQFPFAQKLIEALNHPRKAFRLNYTLTEVVDGKRSAPQHFALIEVDGQSASLKQGSKVPVATTHPTKEGDQPEVTYFDVGMNFQATLTESSTGLSLRTTVEQSSIADEKSALGPMYPLVRQTVLEGIALLTPGKSTPLGTISFPNTNRQIEIEVTAEPLH